MAAPLTYNILITDSSNGGLGPFTCVTTKNNTTAASGGTTLLTQSNTLGDRNPVELLTEAQGWVSDAIATLISTDTRN